MSQHFDAVSPSMLNDTYSGASPRRICKEFITNAQSTDETMQETLSLSKHEKNDSIYQKVKGNHGTTKSDDFKILKESANSSVSDHFTFSQVQRMPIKQKDCFVSSSIDTVDSKSSNTSYSHGVSHCEAVENNAFFVKNSQIPKNDTSLTVVSMLNSMKLNSEASDFISNSPSKFLSCHNFSFNDMCNSAMENKKNSIELSSLKLEKPFFSSQILNKNIQQYAGSYQNTLDCMQIYSSFKHLNYKLSNEISCKSCKDENAAATAYQSHENDNLIINELSAIYTPVLNCQNLSDLIPLLIRYLYSLLACSFLNEEEVKIFKGVRKCSTQCEAKSINTQLAYTNFCKNDIFLLPTDSAFQEFIKELEICFISYNSVTCGSLPFGISEKVLLASMHDAYVALQTLVNIRDSALMSWLRLIRNQPLRVGTGKFTIDPTHLSKDCYLEKECEENRKDRENEVTLFIPPVTPWKTKFQQIIKKNEAYEKEHIKLRNQILSLQYDLEQERQLRQKERFQIFDQKKGALKVQETRAMRERQNLRQERNYLRIELSKAQKALEDVYTRPEEHFLDLFKKIAEKLKSESDVTKKNYGREVLLALQREAAWDVLFPFSRSKSETESIGFTFGVPFHPKTFDRLPAIGYEKPYTTFLSNSTSNNSDGENKLLSSTEQETNKEKQKNSLRKLQPAPPLRISYLCKKHLQVQHDQMKAKIKTLEDIIQNNNEKLARNSMKIKLLENDNANIHQNYHNKLLSVANQLKDASNELLKMNYLGNKAIKVPVGNSEERRKFECSIHDAGSENEWKSKKERQHTAELTSLIKSLQQKNMQLIEQNQYFISLLRRRHMKDISASCMKPYNFSSNLSSFTDGRNTFLSSNDFFLDNSNCHVTSPPPSTPCFDSFSIDVGSDLSFTNFPENDRNVFNHLNVNGRRLKQHVNFEKNTASTNNSIYNLSRCTKNAKKEARWQQEYNKAHFIKTGISEIFPENAFNKFLRVRRNTENLLSNNEQERIEFPTKTVLNKEALFPIIEIKKKKGMKMTEEKGSTLSYNSYKNQNSCDQSNQNYVNNSSITLLLDGLSNATNAGKCNKVTHSELSDFSPEFYFVNEYGIQDDKGKVNENLKLDVSGREQSKSDSNYGFNISKECTQKHTNQLTKEYLKNVSKEESIKNKNTIDKRKKFDDHYNYALFQNKVNYLNCTKSTNKKVEKLTNHKESNSATHLSTQSGTISMHSSYTFMTTSNEEIDEIVEMKEATSSPYFSLSSRETPNGSTCSGRSCCGTNEVIPSIQQHCNRNLNLPHPDIHLDLSCCKFNNIKKKNNGKGNINHATVSHSKSLSLKSTGSKIRELVSVVNESDKNGFDKKINDRYYDDIVDVIQMQRIHPICTSRRHYVSSLKENKYNEGDFGRNNKFLISNSPFFNQSTSRKILQGCQTICRSVKDDNLSNKNFYHFYNDKNRFNIDSNENENKNDSTFAELQQPLSCSDSYYTKCYFQKQFNLSHEANYKDSRDEYSVQDKLLLAASEYGYPISQHIKIPSLKPVFHRENSYDYSMIDTSCLKNDNKEYVQRDFLCYSAYDT